MMHVLHDYNKLNYTQALPVQIYYIQSNCNILQFCFATASWQGLITRHPRGSGQVFHSRDQRRLDNCLQACRRHHVGVLAG